MLAGFCGPGAILGSISVSGDARRGRKDLMMGGIL